MKNPQPPKWAERLLHWYCAPEFLDEIQGDVRELYAERLGHLGKFNADIRYIFDIISFCRWSNIKRSSIHRKPDHWDILIHSSLKIASRTAGRNKLIFSLKVLTLSLCFAFSLLLAAFVMQEYAYDQHICNYQDVYRIGTKTFTRGDADEFATSPGLLAKSLVAIPEIDCVTSFSYLSSMHVFGVDEASFSEEKGIVVDEDFARVFNPNFILGTSRSLSEPDNIVLTESTAYKFFGNRNPIGQIISFNNGLTLDVTGIVEDPLPTSHLQFDVLISRSSFDVQPTWDELSVYTYCKLKSQTDVEVVENKIAQVFNSHKTEITRGLTASKDDVYVPIMENIAAIHLNDELRDDIAIKRDVTNLHFLIILSVAFFLSGFINYLNLSIADITSNLKQIGVMQIMGGLSSAMSHSIWASTILGMIILLPLTILLFVLGMYVTGMFLDVPIGSAVLASTPFIMLLCSFLCMFFLSSKICFTLISKSFDLVVALKGRLGTQHSNISVRQYMLGIQLVFSIVIIGLIFIMTDQFDFIVETDKGFEDQQIVVIRMPVIGYVSGVSPFEESLRSLKGVQSVSLSSLNMKEDLKHYAEIETDEGVKGCFFNYHSCGYDFIDLLQIDLVKGRNFDRSRSTDRSGKVYLINESAMKAYGWKQPIGKEIYVNNNEGHVIGVVKDFRTTSMYNEVAPMIITLNNKNTWDELTYVKLDPTDLPGSLAEIEEVYLDHFQGTPFVWEFLDTKLVNLYREDAQLRDIFRVGLFISLIISCLSIFSISALMLILRAKEMSIRIVVGARPFDLFYLHVSNFIKFILVAMICSGPVLYYLSKYWLDNFAYRIDLNASYFIVPGLITAIIVLITSGIHGFWSSKIDVLKVLNEG